jgi:glycosyltransferase involved in cell wall biosynthesis
MSSATAPPFDRPIQFVFLNRFFFPDHSATSQILSDLAFHLAERGGCIDVIASRQLYGDPNANLAARDSVRGVQIHRVATTRFGRNWLPGRLVDYSSFYVSAAIKLCRIAHCGDVVVLKTDPPMLSVLGAILAPIRGFKAVNWLQDLYPEIAAEFGVLRGAGPAWRVLVGLRNFSLRHAALNVAVGDDMGRTLSALGLPAEKISVIHNWTDDGAIVPVAHASNPLRREWGLEGKFVVAYSGNLGRAHETDTVLGAAELLRNRAEIVFLFVGGGFEMSALATEVRNRKLPNFLFKPYQSRESLSQSLGVGDVHWLSLKAGMNGLVLPSKFYGIAAAGRLVVVIGSPDSELSRLVAQADCGFSIGLGRTDEFARTIEALLTDQTRCRRMGLNARSMLEQHFTKADALERWRTVLRAVLANPRRHYLPGNLNAGAASGDAP